MSPDIQQETPLLTTAVQRGSACTSQGVCSRCLYSPDTHERKLQLAASHTSRHASTLAHEECLLVRLHSNCCFCFHPVRTRTRAAVAVLPKHQYFSCVRVEA
jgi:hypothetical protein